MTSLLNRLIGQEVRLHVSCTGAGTQLIGSLWAQPGASKFLVGSAIPYDRSELRSHLGFQIVDSSVTADVAMQMAMASFVRAAEATPPGGLGGQAWGLGITAAVASDRLPRGEQRFHIALLTPTQALETMVVLQKGAGAELRASHDDRIAQVARALLVAALEGEHDPAAARRATALCFERPVFNPDGTRALASTQGLYLPATLNPLHLGHREMLTAAEKTVGGGVRGRYLVTRSPVHKPSLSVQELLSRAGMVRADRWEGGAHAVEFSQDDPLFVDKARQRPGSTFVIGSDTMNRMLDPSWGVDVGQVLSELERNDARFLVMGRTVQGQFLSCGNIAVPDRYRARFQALVGRFDISSTELRQQS